MNSVKIKKQRRGGGRGLIASAIGEILSVSGDSLSDMGIIDGDDYAEWLMANHPEIDPDSYPDYEDDPDTVAEYLISMKVDPSTFTEVINGLIAESGVPAEKGGR